MMETKEEEENTEWEEEKVSPGKEEISFDRKCHSFLRNKRKTRNAGGIAEGEPVHDLKEHPRNSHNRNYRRPTAEIITTETENQLAESNAGESKYKNKRRKENEHRLVLNKEHRSSHHTENTEPYILVGGNIGTHPPKKRKENDKKKMGMDKIPSKIFEIERRILVRKKRE